MPRSKFRLEPLLKIRRLEEDRAKRVVAERLREIQAVQQRIARLEEHLVEAGGTMRSLVLAGRIVPLEASRQRGYIGSLQMQRLMTLAEFQGLQGRLVADRRRWRRPANAARSSTSSRNARSSGGSAWRTSPSSGPATNSACCVSRTSGWTRTMWSMPSSRLCEARRSRRTACFERS
jgi:flagellar export protein FliJ